MVIPNHVHIETIKGLCTAQCSMCLINKWKPHTMSAETYNDILDKVAVYKENIKFLSLFWRGEPLLDETLCEKIQMSNKKLSLSTSIGIASNCTELTPSLSEDLIRSKLGIIICGIDGIDKETHESIRVGTDYREVVENVKDFIKIRNNIGKTRVMIRFIRQKSNYEQWDEYKKYWSEFIDSSIGDSIVKVDAHNWGGAGCEKQISSKEDISLKNFNKPLICEQLYSRLIIKSDGNAAFCCVLEDDDYNFELGNIFERNLADIYNGNMFKHYRDEMQKGNICDLEYCKNCSFLFSKD